MNPLRRPISLLILCLFLGVSSWAQVNPILQPSNAKSPEKASSTDALGRQTPNGTLYGFLQAMQAGNYLTAAQYLQLSPARRARDGEQLAVS